ncbi:low redox class II peroxidase [Heterobasidion irregulare TC 32-1]|uniref:Peroxidase n=1 Tax=Heterobasidion irregulare (strain TC 32-1) TaxID=747525 RepID=W4K5T6_HETIT|nr:low redox class II peroxidase [Heterobasidion irregulare TC 32-1]ETW80401.1 low redox class II peroxidase [Heterobasidion irregulare TC 32-1]
MAFNIPTLLFAAFAFSSLAHAAITPRVECADGSITTNKACCPLFSLRDQLQRDFFEGECDFESRGSLRLAFHDAVGYSLSNPNGGGGADGSIMQFASIENAYDANLGIDEIVNAQLQFLATHNVSLSYGDFIQFASAVGLTNCPGAPTLDFYLGRPDAKAAAPDDTVPEPFHTPDIILARMADVGFTPNEVVALLASHTMATSKEVDETIAALPFDSTPATFDTQFYLESLLNGTMYPGADGKNFGQEMSPFGGVIRITSDYLLARDSRTACQWQGMIKNQSRMQSAFKAAMKKLSLVGQNELSLIDCSEVILPAARVNDSPHFPHGTSEKDVDQSCNMPFPDLPTTA